MAEAGTYAEQRYRRGLARYRRRLVTPLALGLLPLLGVALAAAAINGGRILWFVAGALVGAAIGVVAVARELPPQHVQNWGTGAAGERATGNVLRPLEADGWHVRHDLHTSRRRNIDHLVRGPHGVFLLETKHLQGRITVEQGVLTARPLDDDDRVWSHRGLMGRVRADAAALGAEIARTERRRPWVQPVVVVWGDFRHRVVEDGGVAYVHGDELVEWLRSRPSRPHELELLSA